MPKITIELDESTTLWEAQEITQNIKKHPAIREIHLSNVDLYQRPQSGL